MGVLTSSRVFTMRAAIVIAACLAVASARTFSKKALSTPLARGGGRIVGGTDAYPGEFPHQIMLTRGVGGSLMCGGSIVGSNKVITAGHCCKDMSASMLGVEVGSHNLYEDDPDQASFAVSDIGLHEDYDSWNISYDICILTLEGSISMGSNVGTIDLPASMEEYAEGTMCTFPDGEPPLRVEALPVFSRRSTSLLCLTTTAGTPARETLAVHSCAATSSPELSLGDTGALRLATQEYTHRHPTSSTGSTPTCKV